LSHDIGVGLVGYGVAGAIFHAPLIRAVRGLQLRTVATSRAGPAGVRVAASVDELLADPHIELVVVASPSATHYSIAMEALLAGKHVVVDKPFATTVTEADDLIGLAKARRLTLSVFQNRRWDNDFLTVKRCLAEGLLGSVYHFEAHYDRFRPQVRGVWREQPGPGSGILYDLGAHLVDQALQLFGMPEYVRADVLEQRESARAVDYFHLILEYGLRRAILRGSMLVCEPGPHFIIHGDKGSFVKYGMDSQEAALRAGGGPGVAGWGLDDPALFGELILADGTRRRVETLPGGYEKYYAGLVESLRGNTPPPVDPADARNGLRVIEAALESAAQGLRVAL
jgi:scyllo-inositol 2-dehydrogenase (NADP+)